MPVFLKRNSDKIEALRTIPLLKGVSRRNLGLLGKYADEVTVPAGKVLVREQGLSREFILILEGRARVEQNGKRLATVRDGDMLGEMSLIDNKPRMATAIAETPMTLLVIDSRTFASLLDEIPELRKKVLVTLCERLRAANAKLARIN
jgi:CRP-like cAMP-binding protein